LYIKFLRGETDKKSLINSLKFGRVFWYCLNVYWFESIIKML